MPTGPVPGTEIKRARAAQLYLKGWSQLAIATELELTQARVSQLLQDVRKRWVAEQIFAMDELKSRELARIDELELAAWNAWERSCQLGVIRTSETVRGYPRLKSKTADAPPPTLVPQQVVDKLVERGQYGDERFLGRIAWCIEMRCKIHGLIQRDDKGKGAIQVNINWDELLGTRPERTGADIIEGQIREIEQSKPKEEKEQSDAERTDGPRADDHAGPSRNGTGDSGSGHGG